MRDMLRIVVLDRATLGFDISMAPLEALGECVAYDTTPQEAVGERMADADVIVINKIKIGEAELEHAKRLRLICITATGYDNVALEACRRHGVAVCNVVGYSTESVAGLTVACALSLWHHLPTYADYVSSGAYTESGVANCLAPVYRELTGAVWGIIGYGNIGQAVARAARAMGCRVIAYSRTPKDGVENVGLDALCRQSDIISLHVPLNDGTRHLIDRERLSLMKPHAVLVNVARGGIWDEAAVADAMREGRLGGVACDVYTKEPFGHDHPFASLGDDRRVLLTPHVAWGAYEARERLVDEVAQNIACYLDGREQNRLV